MKIRKPSAARIPVVVEWGPLARTTFAQTAQLRIWGGASRRLSGMKGSRWGSNGAGHSGNWPDEGGFRFWALAVGGGSAGGVGNETKGKAEEMQELSNPPHEKNTSTQRSQAIGTRLKRTVHGSLHPRAFCDRWTPLTVEQT